MKRGRSRWLVLIGGIRHEPMAGLCGIVEFWLLLVPVENDAAVFVLQHVLYPSLAPLSALSLSLSLSFLSLDATSVFLPLQSSLPPLLSLPLLTCLSLFLFFFSITTQLFRSCLLKYAYNLIHSRLTA